MPKLRPRLIIFNVPQEVDKDNAADIISNQNEGLIGENDHFEVKTLLTGGPDKTRRSLVVEVDPGLRWRMLRAKLKIRFSMCAEADNVFLRRCFHCSQFHGDRADECRGRQARPLCAADHRYAECTHKSDPTRHRCVNCIYLNSRMHKTELKVDYKHTALDRNCPSYLAGVNRICQMIDHDANDNQ